MTSEEASRIDSMSMSEFVALPLATKRAYAKIPLPPERVHELMAAMTAYRTEAVPPISNPEKVKSNG